ncbi:MAG TPA: hypothetical protein DEB74_06365 [Lachnospiraceae bacterium]|nr:hypothetical protein [Lachnospiraceae bacterium]
MGEIYATLSNDEFNFVHKKELPHQNATAPYAKKLFFFFIKIAQYPFLIYLHNIFLPISLPFL